MKKIFYLILLIPIGIFAQTKKDIAPRNESFITIDIFSPFLFHPEENANTPRWRLGYIKNLNEKSKIGFHMGYGNSNVSLIETGDKYSLWEIRPQYYHIINPNRRTLKYFSIEMFYIHHNEKFMNQWFINNQNNHVTFDKANYNRQKLGITPKFGMFFNLTSKIGLNLYTGVGVNYRINNYNNFENLREQYLDVEIFSPYYREEGNRIGVEFSFGMKLYYRIKKNTNKVPK